MGITERLTDGFKRLFANPDDKKMTTPEKRSLELFLMEDFILPSIPDADILKSHMEEQRFDADRRVEFLLGKFLTRATELTHPRNDHRVHRSNSNGNYWQASMAGSKILVTLDKKSGILTARYKSFEDQRPEAIFQPVSRPRTKPIYFK